VQVPDVVVHDAWLGLAIREDADLSVAGLLSPPTRAPESGSVGRAVEHRTQVALYTSLPVSGGASVALRVD
jgi:hypothetical protein